MRERNEPLPWTGLIDISALTGLFAALVYTAGWSYAYHYFARFRLGLLGISIEREYFFLYGFWALKAHRFYALLFLISCTGLSFLFRFLWRKAMAAPGGKAVAWLRAAVFAGGPFCLLLLFICFSWLGKSAGRADFDGQQGKDFADLPRVKVWVEGRQDERAEAWASGCYQLLLGDKDNLYLFLAEGMKDRMPLEIIPAGRVESVRVVPWHENGEECL